MSESKSKTVATKKTTPVKKKIFRKATAVPNSNVAACEHKTSSSSASPTSSPTQKPTKRVKVIKRVVVRKNQVKNPPEQQNGETATDVAVEKKEEPILLQRMESKTEVVRTVEIKKSESPFKKGQDSVKDRGILILMKLLLIQNHSSISSVKLCWIQLP
jgi:hypothetical protein